MNDSITVMSLHRYPVKGLNAETLEDTTLEAGQCIAFDRAYAIENGAQLFDPANPHFLPKTKFLMLALHERMAALDAKFDEETQTLQIYRDGKPVAKGRLEDRIGRQLLEQFFSAYMSDELRGAPRVVHAPGHAFTDVPEKCLSFINLASVRDAERVIGRPIDPMRFRANVYFDGLEPWAEFDCVDREFSVSSGARLAVMEPIQRCAAVNVDPGTAQRDMTIPRALSDSFGHMNMGVYAKVVAGGKIATGDAISFGV